MQGPLVPRRRPDAAARVGSLDRPKKKPQTTCERRKNVRLPDYCQCVRIGLAQLGNRCPSKVRSRVMRVQNRDKHTALNPDHPTRLGQASTGTRHKSMQSERRENPSTGTAIRPYRLGEGVREEKKRLRLSERSLYSRRKKRKYWCLGNRRSSHCCTRMTTVSLDTMQSTGHKD